MSMAGTMGRVRGRVRVREVWRRMVREMRRARVIGLVEFSALFEQAYGAALTDFHLPAGVDAR